MIRKLKIKNLGSIEEVDISFKMGLHVITSDTAEGKSLLLEAIKFILGEDISSEVIRQGCESAIVEACVFIPDGILYKIINLGVDTEAYELIISREINRQGENICIANGKIISLELLKKLMEPFTEIYGEQEQIKVWDAQENLAMLDGYGKLRLKKPILGVKRAFFEYKKLLDKLETMLENDANESEKAIFLKEQIQDITALNLREGEEDELESKRTLLLQQKEISEEDISAIEDRLSELQEAKRTYEKVIPHLIVYKKQLERELYEIENKDCVIKELRENIEKAKQEYFEKTKWLTEVRKQLAGELEQVIMSEFRELSVPNVQFKIHFKETRELSHSGNDSVEFLFSEKTGETMRTIYEVTSSGEVSRVMLAFKSIFIYADPTPTIIFDEIDSGLNDDAARKVAEKLAHVSRFRQIFCVTQIPEIAVMGDVHVSINNGVINDITRTTIEALDEDKIIDKLCKMLSCQDKTGVIRDEVISMREKAGSFKESLSS
ncbi:AAA family ATPase [Desulfuribacillus alkaliarsenatis]|uniref:DNA repair protein RecN n=1 Tax=Desulfuribacillus alkaliarsenatis TaxID=766136 RepID=A0A1E5G4J8_9FIRM|nr:AAA family ATPase [Desulfuribacillus alkaliarsenatis]OEF98011.1 hypothetical protein BHF68_13190 [Desulfuribacillus alkaliarsenatis]